MYDLAGSIPSTVAKLSNLRDLDLSFNRLTGAIPFALGKLTNLEYLILKSNDLNGSIPSSLCNLIKLIKLDLGWNQISGSIPSQIWNLKNLERLDLSFNKLDGIIPPKFTNLRKLEVLYLSSNLLVGQIPATIGMLSNLSTLDLSNNKLSGFIPPGIGSCSKLSKLKLNSNNFIGHIPVEIMNILEIYVLDLSDNTLKGSIPDFSRHLILLKFLNLSFNDLHGEVPTNLQYMFQPSCFKGNKGLCGQVNGLQACNKSSSPIIFYLEIFLPIITFIAILCLGYLLLYKCKVRKPILISTKIKNGDLFSIWNYDGKIAFEDMIKATEDFDIKYCIGTGGYGSVYRARLPNGKVVALKKLHQSEFEEPTYIKSFENEAKVLLELRHRSIMKLHGVCVHRKCMFLVYEYMEKGSLFRVLRVDEEATELGWNRRVDAIKSIAHALAYLHHHCSPSIVHRDISSNNILLNTESQAFVGDFGLARFLQPDTSNRTILAGTYGYIAPGNFLYLQFSYDFR